jgi:hypothetical protein
MISSNAPLASWFLLLTASFFLVLYAAPLLLVPMRWARWLRWSVVPGRNDLCVYFGRCLGAVAVAVIISLFRAVHDPIGNRGVFDLVAQIGVLMVGVHVWGWLRREQPWTETAEIGLYAAVTVLALWIRSSLG